MTFGPVLYCGDPHGQFDHIVKAARELQPSAIVLLGDMQAQRPLEAELGGIDPDSVFLIHGNHDTDSDSDFDNLWGSPLASRSIDGRVVTLPSGLRMAGLGGIFRGAVWQPGLAEEPRFRSRAELVAATSGHDEWRGGMERRHWSTIFPDEFDRLAEQQTDILVTHEAPGYHHHGFDILDTLAQSMGAKVTVHGHHHDHVDSSERWIQQGFRSYGVGLRGITAIDAGGNATVIVPGELDDARDYRQRYLDVFKDVEL